MSFQRIAFVASSAPVAQEALAEMIALYGQHDLANADVVVALGGDGFMLQTLHQMLDDGRVIPAYGLNLGTVGFLMNKQYSRSKFLARINRSKRIVSPTWWSRLKRIPIRVG